MNWISVLDTDRETTYNRLDARATHPDAALIRKLEVLFWKHG